MTTPADREGRSEPSSRGSSRKTARARLEYAEGMNYLAHLHLGAPAAKIASAVSTAISSRAGGRGRPGSPPASGCTGASTSIPTTIPGDPGQDPVARGAAAGAGLLVDVFFDHCLARLWHDYAEQPLRISSRTATRPCWRSRSCRRGGPHCAPDGASGLAGQLPRLRRAGSGGGRHGAAGCHARSCWPGPSPNWTPPTMACWQISATSIRSCRPLPPPSGRRGFPAESRGGRRWPPGSDLPVPGAPGLGQHRGQQLDPQGGPAVVQLRSR